MGSMLDVLINYLALFDWLPVCEECAKHYFKAPDDFTPQKEGEDFKVFVVAPDIEMMNFVGTKSDGSPLECKIGDCKNLADYQLYVVGAGL